MHSESLASRVRVSGRLHGRELAGIAAFTIGEDGMELRSGNTRIDLRWEFIEGCIASERGMELLLLDGDALILELPEAGHARSLANEVLSRACVLPEVTRPLRTFWAPRSHPDLAHERFFSPLLSARMRAARMLDVGDRARALDPASLRRDVRVALRAIATERVPQPGPEQRALEAELEEVTRPVFAALHALAGAAEELVRSPAARRISAWREWTRAVQGLFATADAVWPRVRQTLAEVGPPPARWAKWRRWLRCGA